jgi:formylglycine-generating enzyme required for sulfatase activity
MEMVRIEAGGFMMGNAETVPDEMTKELSYPKREELAQLYPQGDPDMFDITVDHVRSGDFDEKPVHKVNITRPFHMSKYEVTNAQYEKFDPSHRALRGKNGFSKEDNEAVVFVSWHEAKAFCDWLSEKEGRSYRLPTEAEWEYACRAGTSTQFWTGEQLPAPFHKNVRRTVFAEPQDKVPLTVGQTPAGPWGLYDMHGNVEEWCHDWYGPYASGEQTDPVGLAESDFKVTRGGSHGTNLYYLRSANRMGTLPENKHWLIGFRVALGEMPKTKQLPRPGPQKYQQNVKPFPPVLLEKRTKPYFKGPRRYVKIPKGAHGPLYWHHNHDAGIVECPNGDLLAIWYTCIEERGRELAVAASRLRYGSQEWEPASPFWDAPDRNDHCPALWFDGKDTIHHFNGLCVAGKWEPLAIIMRTSKDNGATWSKARLIAPEHGFRQMVGEPVFRTKDGTIVLGADASPDPNNPVSHGSTIWISKDSGQTWTDPGGTLNGIHAGIVELLDGTLMALGRRHEVFGWMAQSISADMGKSWTPSPSIFAPITGGQRAVLLRLKEGPLFFASFAKDIHDFNPISKGARAPRHVSSMFGALSFDDGKTWPVRKVISDATGDRVVDTIDHAPVLMNAHNSEPLAYLSICQSPDNVIHLISSTNHYEFNLAWLKKAPPQTSKLPTAKKLATRKNLTTIYDATKLPNKTSPAWHFADANIAGEPAASIVKPGILAVGKNTSWSNERIRRFEQADAHKGMTAEVAVQVTDSSKQRRGFDFEVTIRGGTLTANHYHLSITATGVYYRYDNQFIKIAEGLDNYTAAHVYRLAVRDDTAVQIYRDGKLIAVKRTDLVIGWREPARGSYIKWGIGPTEAKASVNSISVDITGPAQPR